VALPVWIDYMAEALKGVRQPPALPAPPDLVRHEGDWLYREWAEGGWVAHLSDGDGPQLAPRPVPADPGLPAPDEPASAPAATATPDSGLSTAAAAAASPASAAASRPPP
jgi:hypothetical protein